MEASAASRTPVDLPPPYSSVVDQDAGEKSQAPGPPPIRPLTLEEYVADGTITPDECISHLKLLAAIADLRDTISRTDGLFSIYERQIGAFHTTSDMTKAHALVREKRWEVYVTRAVDRFTTWFHKCIVPDNVGSNRGMVTVSDIEHNGILSWFPEWNYRIPWTTEILPPLDILMVWHAYMLNPRDFLEDCLRQGKMSFWASGLPWSEVNACINDTTLDYDPGDNTKNVFEMNTGLFWDNLHDPPVKTLSCPRCHEVTAVPWTDDGPDIRSLQKPFEHCSGYADRSFRASCPFCGIAITHESLRLAKFQTDVQKLVQENLPMPGTLLTKAGIPQRPMHVPPYSLFPNTLILRSAQPEIMKQCDLYDNLLGSISGIRDVLERSLKSHSKVRDASYTRTGTPRPAERFALRKMMSRYWTNSSPFALDLVGAVVRQGTFIQKMDDFDWLHSPALDSTMQRLIDKYKVFFQLMAANPDHIAVPTLDVDLAWHTHQLSPRRYAAYSIRTTESRFINHEDKIRGWRLIDHDDKIPEKDLTSHFQWTSKEYQKMTGGQLYSECTCWYCEAIRELHNGSPSIFSSNSTALAHKNAARLHDESDISPDPTKNPHISAHNAVHITGNRYLAASTDMASRLLRANYERSRRRREKRKARKPVEKDDSPPVAMAFGLPVSHPPFILPFAVDPAITNEMYPCDPVSVVHATGTAGNCIAGACGGGVSSGGCCADWGGPGGGCGGGCGGGGCGGGGGGGGGGGCGGGGGGGGGGGC